jgi:hypothetical protein
MTLEKAMELFKDEQVTCAGEKQADIEREGSQQVYNAEETEYVFPWAGRTVNACQVFESEESGEKIFHNDERSRQVGGDAFQAFDDNEQYTDQDTTDKNHVEQLPRRGVRFEDDDV